MIAALVRGIADALPALVAAEVAATVTPLRAQLEQVMRELETRPPAWRYVGTWTAGQRYEVGDIVTWGGSSHLAREATSSEPMKSEAKSRAWALIAQRGKTGGRCKGGHTEDQHR